MWQGLDAARGETWPYGVVWIESAFDALIRLRCGGPSAHSAGIRRAGSTFDVPAWTPAARRLEGACWHSAMSLLRGLRVRPSPNVHVPGLRRDGL